MLINVNGKTAEIPDGSSVRELMSVRNLPDKGVVIVLNGDIITAEQSQNIKFNPNDSVDIIQIIEGG